MILKNKIKYLSKSCLYASKLLGILSKYMKPGFNGLFLNKKANEFIYDNKLLPAFLNFNRYPYSICVSINDEIIHGVPNNKIFKNGDIITVDCGVIYKKYYSDCAYTFPIGNINNINKKLLKVTKNSLYLAIKKFKNNLFINNIGSTIYNYIKKYNFDVVTNYCGHGIGKYLHEDPLIYNHKIKNNFKIKSNKVISIEPLSTIGNSKNYVSNNKWTIKTVDKSNAAHYEHNIAIINNKCKILTTFNYIK